MRNIQSEGSSLSKWAAPLLLNGAQGRHQPPLQVCRRLAEKPGEQRHQQKADQRDAATGHELFHALGFSPRIIISVALQQVNDAPDSETCAKGDDEGLKNIDSRVKEIHKCVCRNMRDIGLEVGSHNASAGTKTAVRFPIPASPFNF